MRDGAYTADRASALSGVPQRTVHDWARKGILVPSVSAERVKLWSYGDLFALRTIYWLRHPKRAGDGSLVPASPMPEVKAALASLASLQAELFEGDRPAVAVTRDGRLVLRPIGHPMQTAGGQVLLSDALDLIAPFDAVEGGHGPDLVAPGPFVRIRPRRLSGAPFVVGSRVMTEALYALALRGCSVEDIHELYPELSREGIADAVRVEAQLATNLAHAA